MCYTNATNTNIYVILSRVKEVCYTGIIPWSEHTILVVNNLVVIELNYFSRPFIVNDLGGPKHAIH